MKFHYEGFTARGEPKKGELEAASEQEASSKLRHEMKIFANKISTEDFKPILEHVMKPSEVVPYEPPPEGMRLNTVPPKPEDGKTVVIPKDQMENMAKTKLGPPHGTREGRKESGHEDQSLERSLSNIARVVRQVEAWKSMADQLKEGDSLPPGQPDVGPSTWKAYESYRLKIISDLFFEAMKEAARLK